MIDSFTFGLDDLAKHAAKHLNIAEQVEGGLKAVVEAQEMARKHSDINIDTATGARLYLLGEDGKYHPALLTEEKGGKYLIVPLVAVHAVTGGTMGKDGGDVYEDFKKILKEGFHPRTRATTFLYRFRPDGDYAPSFEYARFSDMFDYFLIEIESFRDNEKDKKRLGPKPFYSNPNNNMGAIEDADPCDLNGIIVTLGHVESDSEITAREIRNYKEEYHKEDLQLPNIRFLLYTA